MTDARIEEYEQEIATIAVRERPRCDGFRAREGQPLARYFDHTALKPQTTAVEIRTLCEEAAKHSVYSVCVPPDRVALASSILKGSEVVVGTVVSFPHGNALGVQWQTKEAIADGAREIDMVIPLGKLRDKNYRGVIATVAEVVDAAQDYCVKSILELSELDEEEKIYAALCAVYGGASMLKTSTGFASGGATLSDIALLRRIAGEHVGVKASGGVKTREFALQCIEHGADRIGSSGTVNILSEEQAYL